VPLIASSLQTGWFRAMFTHSQQPTDWLVLSHVDCLSQREIVGLEVV